jgi:hypothetical protein
MLFKGIRALVPFLQFEHFIQFVWAITYIKIGHSHSPTTLTGIAGPSPIETWVRVRVTLRLTVCQSVRLGIEPTLRLVTRCCFRLEGWCLNFAVLYFVGRPLWREVGSVICSWHESDTGIWVRLPSTFMSSMCGHNKQQKWVIVERIFEIVLSVAHS